MYQQMPQLCSSCNIKPSQSIINLHCNHVLCDSCVYKSSVETKIKSQINKQITQNFYCLVCQNPIELTKEQNLYLQELVSKGKQVESDFGNNDCSKCVELEFKLNQKEQELNSLKQSLQNTQSQQSEQIMNQQLLKNELEHLRAQIQNVQSLNLNLDNQIKSYSQYIAQQQMQEQTLAQEIRQKEQEIINQKSLNEKHQQMIQNGFIYYDAKIKSYEEALEICQNQLNQAQNKINEQEQQIQDMNQQKQKNQNEYQINNLKNQVQTQQNEMKLEQNQNEEIIKNMQLQMQLLQSDNLNLKNFYNQVKEAFDCVPCNEREKLHNQKIVDKGKQI